uniref:Fibrinogen C-terminal domain-containing protein n=1 Tax=Eutreptiella gymnastica TaxID=73025 RepID=A0A7S4G2G6_9EUGL
MMACKSLVLVAVLLFCASGFPVVDLIDNEPEELWLQRGTSINAELVEERSKGTITVEGTDLVNGLLFKFSPDCVNGSLYTYAGQDEPMELYGVETDPLNFLYGKRGYLTLLANQTHTSYRQRKICYTTELSSHNFTWTGLTVNIFEITAVAGFTSIPDQKFKDQIEKIRAYKYSTVVYVVEGIALSDRLQISLQYSCKNNGLASPFAAETPASLYGTNANGTSAYVRFGRTQTDYPFASKDLCVSRGNNGHYDFSGFIGNTMTVFADCIEDPCIEGSCHQPTGNCLCYDAQQTEWLICESDKRNITAYVNQSQVPPDPHMCKDIKWGHYEPDRAVDQMYLVNPTDVDRFSIKCDMVDGGWSSIPATYVETQELTGGGAPQWMTQNVTYDITLQRMEDLRNLSLYSKQEAMAYCRSTYSDFSCPRASYHTIHESVWHEWTNLRLWPVYDFDGCCYWCCQHSRHWRSTKAKFWSINLPIRNVMTFYGGADDNSEEFRVEMQPVKFY